MPIGAIYDLVIRGGELADGDGGPLRHADVAMTDGRIVAVGSVAGRGRDEFDARGKLVTPGFVDIHTHYDGQATWYSRLHLSSWHGVPTPVTAATSRAASVLALMTGAVCAGSGSAGQ